MSIKIILAGNSGVGKSCFMQRFTDNEFASKFEVTVGVEFKVRDIEVCGIPVKIQIWDTAGQENFQSITRSFYKKADAVMLLYDISCKASFEGLDRWLKDIKENANLGTEIYLIGSQADLEDKREVSREEGIEYCKLHNLCGFMEVSSKTGDNVEESFQDFSEKLFKKRQEAKSTLSQQAPVIVLSTDSVKAYRKKKKCC